MTFLLKKDLWEQSSFLTWIKSGVVNLLALRQYNFDRTFECICFVLKFPHNHINCFIVFFTVLTYLSVTSQSTEWQRFILWCWYSKYKYKIHSLTGSYYFEAILQKTLIILVFKHLMYNEGKLNNSVSFYLSCIPAAK